MTQSLSSRISRLFVPRILFYKNPFKIYEYYALFRHADVSRQDVVLDLGCGTGKPTSCLAQKAGRVTGIDPDATAIRVAAGTVAGTRPAVPLEFRCTSLPDPALADSSFDRIVSFSVLEHIADVAPVLADCRRLLKPGGQLVFTTDSIACIDDPALRERHRREHRVLRYYSEQELRDQLAAAGFKTVSVEPLLRSTCARRLFEKGIRNGFAYSHIQSVAEYFRIRLHEALTPGNRPGLFLLAKAGT